MLFLGLDSFSPLGRMYFLFEIPRFFGICTMRTSFFLSVKHRLNEVTNFEIILLELNIDRACVAAFFAFLISEKIMDMDRFMEYSRS